MPQPDPGNWAAVTERLRRCALALTGSPEHADDLTQETLARLLARSPQKADHHAYARQTMVRLWLDRQRALRRRLARLARLAVTADRWHRDGNRPEREEQVARVRAAAGRLPPRQRAVLVLRLLEEQSYGQIARELGCSVASVRSSLHLARARVRRALEETS